MPDFMDSIRKTGKPNGPSSWDGYIAAITSDACLKAQQTGEKELIQPVEKPVFHLNTPRFSFKQY